jgi:hypothetical protein
LRKRQTIVEKQCHNLTFWQRLILVSAILLSGEIAASIMPSQTVHAINCRAGYGGSGGVSYGEQGGARGVGGDCVIGGNKSFVPGGFNQNNGNQGHNQINGGGNML